MTARDLVIEILGTDDGVEEHDMAAVFSGGVCAINHKNPSQYKIFLSNIYGSNGETLACAIHESFHCKRAREGVKVYKKDGRTWSVKERHEEEYNVILLTEGYLNKLYREGRIETYQLEEGMALCRESRKSYTISRVAMTKGITTIAGIMGRGIMRIMPQNQKEMVQEHIDAQTAIFSFDNN